VDNEVKVPVQRLIPSTLPPQTPTARSPQATPNIRVLGRSEAGNESDWQTVASECVKLNNVVPTHNHVIQLGSSLADVSDVSDYTSCGYERTPSHVLCEQPRQSKIRKRGPVPSTRNQLQTAIRRISSSLDGITNGWRLANQDYEMQHIRGSFDSLASSNSSDDFYNGTRWESFSPVSLEAAARVHKQHVSDTSSVASPKIPRLPFPLIPLPEAAKLQYVRRERGEEDHTEPGNSFVSRAFSETVSTISASTSPRTPQSLLLSAKYSNRGDQPNRPSPAYSRWGTSRDNSGKGTLPPLPFFFFFFFSLVWFSLVSHHLC
jgi:hypothetical protein